MSPVVALMVSPIGKLVAENFVGFWVAVIWWVKTLPKVEFTVAALVMTGTDGKMEIERG